MMNRRALLFSVPAALVSAGALAEDPDYDGPVYRPDKDTAEWFESLERPDYDSMMMSSKSCCSSGDAYPIKILEEATIGGKQPDGRAVITDGSKRMIVLPNGSRKYRPAITGSLDLRFAGERVTREKNGNPTPTAWVFLRVMDGKVDYVYCVVPLPPGF
jgi:hypothetical protein